jgi:hypothetical protein
VKCRCSGAATRDCRNPKSARLCSAKFADGAEILPSIHPPNFLVIKLSAVSDFCVSGQVSWRCVGEANLPRAVEPEQHLGDSSLLSPVIPATKLPAEDSGMLPGSCHTRCNGYALSSDLLPHAILSEDA